MNRKAKLLDMLESDHPAERHRAARALHTYNEPDVVAVLVAVLREDPERVVRRGAATSLGLIGDAAAMSALLEALQDHPLVAEEAEKALEGMLFE